MTSEPLDEQPGHPDGRHLIRTLVLCAILSLAVSLLFALTRGEFVTQFHRACLKRYTDIQGYVYHEIQGTAGSINPVYSSYIRWNRTALVTIALALIKAGIAYPLALNLMVLVMRTFFGLGISWLIFAATRRRYLALIGVLLAYCFPANASIYGHAPQYALTGFFSTSLFLVACSLNLLGCRRSSLACWLFQLWVHPTTFVCWSPVFVGLFLIPYLQRSSASSRWLKSYLGLLVLGPPAAGIAAGLAEAAGLLPFHGDEYYWALVRVRSCHSVFLFSSNYALPLHYLSQVVGLFLLAFPAKAGTSPLRPFNMLAGFLGLGIALTYAAAVETHFSVAAAMCLPLRFECVMYPLIVANVFYAVFCLKPGRARESAFSALYGLLLLFPSLKPLLWAWAWAAGCAWFQAGEQRRRRYLAAAIAGTTIAFLYLVLAPSHEALMWNVAYAARSVKALACLIVAFGLSLRVKRIWPRPVCAALCVAIILIAPRTWVLRPGPLLSEIKAIVLNSPESSPQKQACDWINTNIPAGTAVFVAQDLYLHKVTHVNTSINKDLIAYFKYAPGAARGIAGDIKRIYGIDVREMARRRERLSLQFEDLFRARRWILNAGNSGQDGFRYIVEPADVTPAPDGTIVFANEYVRIYSVGFGSARHLSNQHLSEPGAQATGAPTRR